MLGRRGGVIRAVLPAGLLVCLATVLPAAPALAHAQLVSTTPVRGSVVGGATEVGLRFDGEILELGAAMRVTGPGGEVSVGRPAVAGAQLTQPLRRGLPDGTYQVLWRATAADGHSTSGEWQFTLAGAAAPSPSTGSPPPAGPTAASPPGRGWPSGAAVAVFVLLAICGVVLVLRRRRVA